MAVYMLTNPFFWLTLIILLNFSLMAYFGLPRVYDRWLLWQSKRRIATIRLSPSVLKNKLKDRDRLIAHLNGALLEAEERIASLEEETDEQRKEIKRLNGRAVMMANELRCDESSDTQVLRSKWSARF